MIQVQAFAFQVLGSCSGGKEAVRLKIGKWHRVQTNL